MKLMQSSILGVEDQRRHFAEAGQQDVEVVEERTAGWMGALGKKPMQLED